MSPRQPFVGGNWKMNTDRRSSVHLARAVGDGLPDDASGVQCAIFPPSIHLNAVSETLRETGGGADCVLGAQNFYPEPEGAFTGEISISQLRDLGVGAALVGHSERRHVIGEPEELIARKTTAALESGLLCVLCVGETLEQRESSKTDAVNEAQIRSALEHASASLLDGIIIAYEPVWAIGTGRTASPADAQSAHERIRALLGRMYDASVAESTRIIYGGSVKSANAAELFSQPDIDGGLIGGASLDADEFLAICSAARPRQELQGASS
ncbi:MAG: triose-phosphate isomerase [Phycisphaeraceae bacterium]|nr:MAG: triose-phosphate isomerase [Phycisphaeraceae bacterium]